MKKYILLIIFFVVIFLTIYKPSSPPFNLEGNWEGKKIIIDGKVKVKHDFFVEINFWLKKILIKELPNSKKTFIIDEFELRKSNSDYYLVLKSTEENLNGKFAISLDTVKSPLYENSKGLRVNLKIYLNRTFLHLQKELYPPQNQKKLNYQDEA